MMVNKRFDRLKQWGKERMGGEVKTDTTDEFKALELEMQLRHDGMERLHRSATTYVKSISRRDAGDDKEKQLPVANLGTTMASHGDDFEPDSEFGQCLVGLGRANERVARTQETYAANATSSWLESIERSLAQMKEYQAARKKLESRRLAYDTASVRMQKSKKEDFRMEEDLRAQRAKYEESSEDVYRRMLDIKEAEVDSIADLTSFLDAELAYYDRCREVLLQLKKDWPAPSAINRADSDSPVNGLPRRAPRSRTNSLTRRYGGIAEDEPLDPPVRPPLGSRVSSGQQSPHREVDLPPRPGQSRTLSGFDAPSSLGRDSSSLASMPHLARVPTDPTHLMGGRSQLRVTKREGSSRSPSDVFRDDRSDVSETPSSAASEHLLPSSAGAWSTVTFDGGKKAPPPPPPSRAKKPPPPPPPPMKRSALSTSEVPRY